MKIDWTTPTLHGPELPTAVYRALDARNASTLWSLYSQCPAVAAAEDYREPSEAMIRGMYVDRELLHGDGDKHVAIRPEGIDGRTKAGKAALAKWREETDDALWRLEQRPDWLSTVRGMITAARSHPDLGPLLDPDNGLVHPVITWTDEATGQRCKAELDKVVQDAQGRAAILDLKTAVTAHPRPFSRTVHRLGYYFKMSWYQHALQQVMPGPPRPLLLGVIEERVPHCCAVYELDLGYHEAGARQWREALDIYAQCAKTGVWPGYPSDILEAPEWLK